MKSSLATYHDLRSIGVVRAYVVETGRFFGADATELKELELAAEEAAGFIIEALRPDREEPFEIETEPIESGLRFGFRNRGIPVDEENLPVYDSRNPEAALAGLPFFLLENLTDAFWLCNEGNQGWVLLFEKRFRNFRPLVPPSPPDEELRRACARESLEVDRARPADAYGIVKLTYHTYRYSYVKEIFYYRKRLEEALAAEDVIAFIGRNREGEVVINSAWLRDPRCRSIVEAGMLMSRPEYRKNRALLKVSRRQIDFLDSSSELRAAYSRLVTTHTGSQRLSSLFGFRPAALFLSVHEAVEFVGIASGRRQRESLLYALLVPRQLDPATICLPEAHLEMTRRLLSGLAGLDFSTRSVEPSAEATQFTVTSQEEDSHGLMIIESFGRDWSQILRRTLNELDNDGMVTVHLQVSADRPLPPGFEEQARHLGLFYSGIIIRTPGSWELLYCRLRAQHFDFAKMALHDENARALCDYMELQYRSLEEVL
jgi:anti-sigma regulatory factor (Ser/Thr protein kinase)